MLIRLGCAETQPLLSTHHFLQVSPTNHDVLSYLNQEIKVPSLEQVRLLLADSHGFTVQTEIMSKSCHGKWKVHTSLVKLKCDQPNTT